MSLIQRYSSLLLVCALLQSGCGDNGGGPFSSSTSSTSGGGSSTGASYSIGGSISGLNGSGLVLENRTSTLPLNAGATSFVFPTQLAAGTTYAVTVAIQPNGELCQVTNGSGTVGSATVSNIAVACVPQWTWVNGSNTGGAVGVYGTQGVAAAANVPGARSSSASWTDASGNFWLFGGWADLDAYNDLWKYSSGQWTWVSGSSAPQATGVYGTKGLAAAANVPGARFCSATWVDATGDLWLFGGNPSVTTTIESFNDLWKYTQSTGQWTWVSGANTTDASGVYGTQGVAAAANVPGARCYAASWFDSSGNLWLFGGSGYDAAGGHGYLNDLWKYSPSSGQWTWIAGPSVVGGSGIYGTQGTAAASNVPGARDGASVWMDAQGNTWLFGGDGYDANGAINFLNDLWKFDPASGQWTWVGGANTGGAQAVYGTQGVAAAANVPGARSNSAIWVDQSGNVWLFGGFESPGEANDLWTYSSSSGEWTWVNGSQTANAVGVYGTLGVPAQGNNPGARLGSAAWTNKDGLWLFGGHGYASGTGVAFLNDLWLIAP
jgi:N-acetylneuraminic acid mutarotase